MKRDLEVKFIEKYPFLFKDANKPVRESLMMFGCECGDGWYKIMDDLFENLSQCEGLFLVRVKEKLGSLRVYFNLEKSNEDINNKACKHIEEAYKKSIKTCEECGNPGETRKGAWLKTLCDKCYHD